MRRRRYVETGRSTHCHLGRAEVDEHVQRAVRAASEDSKIEVTRRGGCVTIRTLEQREVIAAPAPFSSPAPLDPKGDR